uniref:Uncharacterized protein n=1 Tax=Arundo donax TaxID=35708 RepID=A0A0A9BYE7_ARUDO
MCEYVLMTYCNGDLRLIKGLT